MHIIDDGGGRLSDQQFARIELETPNCRYHRVLPHTNCRDCAPRGIDDPESAILAFSSRKKLHPEDSRAENPNLGRSKLFDQFVDPFTGLVRNVYQAINSTYMPMYVAELWIPEEQVSEMGYGRASTKQTSEFVAILEAVERHAGHLPRRVQPTHHGSYREMSERYGVQCFDPKTLSLHTHEDKARHTYRFVDYSDDLEFDWCWVHSFERQSVLLVPSQLFFYRLVDQQDRPTNRFIFESSNGCALGGSMEEAVLKGLYEVVERDSYFSTWYLKYSPSRIRLESIDSPIAQGLIARAVSEGYEIHLLDNRHDINIPVVIAMIVDPAADAVVKSYCASGASGRWIDAIESALIEVVSSMGVYRQSMVDQRAEALSMLEDDFKVTKMENHVLLYNPNYG